MKALFEIGVLIYAWRTRHVRRRRPTGTFTMIYHGKTTGPIPYESTLELISLVAEPLGLDVKPVKSA